MVLTSVPHLEHLQVRVRPNPKGFINWYMTYRTSNLCTKGHIYLARSVPSSPRILSLGCAVVLLASNRREHIMYFRIML